MDDGSILEMQEDIEHEVVYYFTNIFSSKVYTIVGSITSTMVPRLTREDTDFLDASFSLQEVETALWKMKSRKAPGPDGMTVSFYQKY